MADQLFSIGEVSKIKGVTIKALRFYDKIGLLPPYYVDPFTSYRYYHINQLMLIDIIKAARKLDISPKDLLPYFQKQDTVGTINLLRLYKEKAKKKITELKNTVKNIEEICDFYEDSTHKGSYNEVFTKKIKRRHIITAPFEQGKTQLEYLYDLSKLDIIITEENLMTNYESGILFELRDGEASPAFLYTTIDKPLNSWIYKTISSGLYACVRYSSKNIETQQLKLTRYINNQMIEPKNLIQVEILTNLFDVDETLWELQIRIN